MGSEQFEEKAKQVKNLTASPTNEEMLELYSLYKQATVGDCNTDRPGMFDLTGKAKWDAWNARKGTSSEEAEELYIKKVDTLIALYGLKE